MASDDEITGYFTEDLTADRYAQLAASGDLDRTGDWMTDLDRVEDVLDYWAARHEFMGHPLVRLGYLLLGELRQPRIAVGAPGEGSTTEPEQPNHRDEPEDTPAERGIEDTAAADTTAKHRPGSLPVSTRVDDFICTCSPQRLQAADQLRAVAYRIVAEGTDDFAYLDVDDRSFITAAVMYLDQFSVHITRILTDQWSVVCAQQRRWDTAAHQMATTWEAVIQCDRVEDGFARLVQLTYGEFGGPPTIDHPQPSRPGSQGAVSPEADDPSTARNPNAGTGPPGTVGA